MLFSMAVIQLETEAAMKPPIPFRFNSAILLLDDKPK